MNKPSEAPDIGKKTADRNGSHNHRKDSRIYIDLAMNRGWASAGV